MNDTRTAAERRYDAERDGSLYFPTPAAVSEPWDAIIGTLLDTILGPELPLEPSEETILRAILAVAPPTDEDE